MSSGFGTFERGGRVRAAATAAQAVRLRYAGWRLVPDVAPVVAAPKPRKAAAAKPAADAAPDPAAAAAAKPKRSHKKKAES